MDNYNLTKQYTGYALADECVDIKIKYMHSNASNIKKIDIGDWIDLYAAEDIIIHRGEMRTINLGVAMQLPKGYEAHILPRSSTYKKWGIIMANSQGIVDESYCGDHDWWLFQAICLEPKSIGITDNNRWIFENKFASWVAKTFFKKWWHEHHYTVIHTGDKIAQFRLIKHMPQVILEKVDILNNEDRGGIGSTGIR